MTTESRLGALEGTTGEHAAAIAGLRDDLREGLADVRTEIRALRAEFAALNARIDRITLAVVVGGVTFTLAQVATIITIVLRT